jgi:hypothetical protein
MIKKLALLTFAANLAACSTIDRGVTDHVRVDTVPQGATASFIYIPSEPSTRHPGAIRRMTCAATPCAFQVGRSQKGIVTVEKDGFEPAQYYVGPSRFRGGAGVNLEATTLKTTSTSLGVGLTGGLYYAAMSQLFTALGNAITLGFGNYQGVSTATGATAGTGIGLGIAAGSMLIDAGTSANSNVYPNPVVIGMAQAGTQAEDDPFVEAYYDLIARYKEKEIACASRRNRNEAGLSCSDTRLLYRDARRALSDLENERDDDIRALIKANKEAEQ